MIYNLSQPNTTLESIGAITPYTFTFNGLILLFIVVIVLTLVAVVCVKRMI